LISHGRRAHTIFEADGSGTKVTTIYDMETQYAIEMQRGGWHALRDNFKRHVAS
jgi:hypothetical protein